MTSLATSFLVLVTVIHVGLCFLGEDDPFEDPNPGGDPGVLEMNGNVFGYEQSGPKKTITGGDIKLDVFVFHDWNRMCLKVVIIYLHGMEVQRVKVPCSPSNGYSEGLNYQFGKAFTIRPHPGNTAFDILYNIQSQYCMRRTYTVANWFPLQLQQSMEGSTQDEECIGLKQGKDVIRAQSSSMNWVLEMNGDMTGYTPNESGHYDSGGRCVNLVIIRIYGALAQRLKMTCGDGKGRENEGQYQLGSVFMFRPEPGTNKIKGLFNIRNEHCFRVMYTFKKGNPNKITRSNGVATHDKQCKDLMAGKDLISGPVPKRPSVSDFAIPISIPNSTPTSSQPPPNSDWFGGIRSALFGGKK